MGTQNDKNQKENPVVTRRTVVIFAVCIVLIFLITQIEAIKNTLSWLGGMLAPVLTGVIFAYIINPLCVIIEKGFFRLISKIKRLRISTQKRISRGLGVLLSILILIAVIALLLFLIIPEFLESFDKLLKIAPSLIEKGGNWLSGLVESDSTFGEHLGESIDTLTGTLIGWIGGEFSTLIGGLLEGAISVVSFFINFLVSLVVCVYALLEKNKFLGQIKKLIFGVFSRQRANDILDVAHYGNEVFGKFVTGKLLTSSVVGIVTFLFMSIMGMPYALLSAGIIAVTNIIPFFGPFIGGIPTAFIILLTDVRQGVIYIVFLVILQQLEGNIIEPMIMEDRTGVSKFWVTVSLLFFGGVFGLPGMIFSVPLVAVIFYCIKTAVERSLVKKSMPLSGTAYLNAGSVDPETGELRPVSEKPSRKRLRDTLSEWIGRFTKSSEQNNEPKNGDDNE